MLASAAYAADPVSIKWLESPAALPAGVAWGVPWPKGGIQKEQAFSLRAADGKALPLQSWPLAYWPDGSIKWMGYATLAGPQVAGPLSLTTGRADVAGPVVQVKETAQAIDIDTGGADGIQCHISRTGANLFDALKIGARTIAQNARSELIVQKGLETDPAAPPTRQRFTSNITKITVEQSGPVRAVVKIEGMHKLDAAAGTAAGGGRQWLPFYVRLYFYPGVTPIKTVYSFVFDGNEKVDFIRGLGLTFSVPFAEEIQNRHVRFGGESGGLWAEPIQPLQTWNVPFTNPGTPNAYVAQLAGQRIANRAQLNANSQHDLDALAQWGDFRLLQPNSQGFSIEKRTSEDGGWIPTGQGTRAPGFVYVGDVSGGMGAGVQNFWQSAPASLEVRHARTNAADLHVWLWSPEAPAMDLRHYDTVAHGLNETYEDVEIPLATPQGIAHTSHLTLFPCTNVPAKDDSVKQVQFAAQPPLLICTPQYLHDQKAFGIWSLQDKTTPFKKSMEEQLDAEMAFYEKAVDQYNWYGFWYYGNVMHGYDANRQTWKYDQGGFAWDNSEQGTDFVAWYMFLRTGRADLFRYAEAMSRYTGEVICYHQGPMAGLGSRHNVVPWGDGAKEARISMAPYRRFYYYLTTDERTGDVMHEMLQADSAITRIDPMRKVIPPTAADAQFPARVRGGPDWFAFMGNWMTEWERTGDPKYRDKIMTSVDSVAAMPFGFSTSQSLLWGFFPETGKVVPRDNNRGSYNLVTNMGGPEVMMELNDLIGDRPGWKKTWFDYCSTGSGRLAGYYADFAPGLTPEQRTAAAQRAISGIRGGVGANFGDIVRREGSGLFRPLDIPQTLNGLVTNNANQSSLQLIEVLDLCKDQLPQDAPPPTAGPGRGGRGGAGRGAAPTAPPAATTPASGG
jgi:hypothetical protein